MRHMAIMKYEIITNDYLGEVESAAGNSMAAEIGRRMELKYS